MSEQEKVFQYLSSGKAEEVLSTGMGKFAATVGIHSMQDLENLVAIYRPGPMMFLEAYAQNTPCVLPQAAGIAASTHNILLYIDQLEEALQLLTDCTPEEAVEFCKENSGRKLNPVSHDNLLNRIAQKQGISLEDAEKIYEQWRSYAAYPGIRRSQAKEIAQGIYLKALERLKNAE